MEPLEAAEILEKGAALIEEKGWTKGLFRSLDDEYCMIGAVRHFALATHSITVVATAEVKKTWDRYQEMLSLMEMVRPEKTKVGVAPDEETGIESGCAAAAMWDFVQWNDYGASGPEEVTEVMREMAIKLRDRANVTD